MKYKLRNGKTVIIRKPTVNDAEAIVNIISTADTETNFLTRNPDEFSTTVEQEKTMINKVLNDNCQEWFVAEYDGKVIGHSSVGLIINTSRCRHRAEVTFVILKDYCEIGIGGKLMTETIKWCKSKNITQIELNVAANNKHAINMYENFGFRITGTIPKAIRYNDETFADEKLMVLEL